MAGSVGAPTPWWQLPGMGAAADNMAKNAPPGYKYDPVSMGYVRTPASLASDASTLINGVAGSVPGLGANGQVLTTPGGTSGGLPPQVTPPSLTGLNTAAGGPSGPMTGSAVLTNGSSGSSSGHQTLAPVDTSAAESAAFNNAKDQVGQTTSGSLTGLRSALASRGMLGSGLEERGTASVVNSGMGQLGDTARQQAITKADLAQKNAETNLNAGVTQRGQDIQSEEAKNSLAGTMALGTFQGQITQRGQDISAEQARQALALEQAQLAQQQRISALTGLQTALNIMNPKSSSAY